MFVQTDVYSPPSLTLLLLLHIFVLQVDRGGGGAMMMTTFYCLKRNHLHWFFYFFCWRTLSAKFEICHRQVRDAHFFWYVKWEQKRETTKKKTLRTYRAPSYSMRNEPFRSGQKKTERKKKGSWDDDDPVGLTTAMVPCFTNQWPRRRIRTKMETLSLAA